MADGTDGPPAKKSKTETTASTSALPLCPYGAKCYCKNPAHFKEFAHPSKDGKKTEASEPIDTSKLPPCPFGTSCYRKNLLHFAQFSHPVKGASGSDKDIPPDDSGSDTDVYNSDDENDKEEAKDSSALKLGKASSLVKKYSQLTEEERKELIKKAFEMKDKLEKELKETKAEVDAKVKELSNLQKEVNKGALLMEGEQEALDSGKIKYFDLMPERSYKEGSAAQLHFRLAESQFYRLLSGTNTGYQVKKVQYVVNPKLVKQFKKSREKLAKTRGEQFSYPVLAFHGTQVKNITPICETGFRVPGEAGFKHRTDIGHYGCGAYFSEFPGFSIAYIQGSTKLLLCQILTGKVFQCTELIQGSALKDGFDSHRSPSKKELVIFRSDHILPCYIVHYKQTNQEFKYMKPADERHLCKNREEMMKLYWKAKKKGKSNILNSKHVQFCGKEFSDTNTNLGTLVEKHGGHFVDDEEYKPKVTMGKTRGRAVQAFVPCPPDMPGTLGWIHFNGTFIRNCNVIVTTEKEWKKKALPPIAWFRSQNYMNGVVAVVREEWVYVSIIGGTMADVDDYSFDE